MLVRLLQIFANLAPMPVASSRVLPWLVSEGQACISCRLVQNSHTELKHLETAILRWQHELILLARSARQLASLSCMCSGVDADQYLTSSDRVGG